VVHHVNTGVRGVTRELGGISKMKFDAITNFVDQ
jgi:hypothetical protein